MIDAVVGSGTAVDAIFEMKEQGIFRGAKRKLYFTENNKNAKATHKSAKLD